MARNRKRRGAARPTDGDPTPPGAAPSRGRDREPSRVDDTSDPLGHAAPDAEIAEAELAEGEARASRLEPYGGPMSGTGLTPRAPRPVPADDGDAGDVYDDELEDADGGGDIVGGDSGGRHGGGGDGDSEDLVPAGRAGPAPRHRNRLIAFLQGSWRELQRVQWPDQRQVVQATGVVIGFVIVAGAWLGLADWVATKIVNLIL